MRLAIVLALLLAPSVTCFAEESNGYVFVGATKPHNSPFTLYQSTFFHVGGGGEAALGRWFGIGAEIGLLLTSDDRSRHTGLASVGPYFHFLSNESRVDPFVTGGYTMLIRGGVGNLGFAGGGMNYWFTDRVGVRGEFRSHPWREGLQFLDFRFGVVFR